MFTKKDLINEMSNKVDFSKKNIEEVVNLFLDTLQKSLKKEKKVTLTGFGTFEVRDRKARMGRNPQTGKEIKIPATKVPAFKPGKELKEAVKK